MSDSVAIATLFLSNQIRKLAAPRGRANPIWSQPKPVPMDPLDYTYNCLPCDSLNLEMMQLVARDNEP